jgi:hypothetical protein
MLPKPVTILCVDRFGNNEHIVFLLGGLEELISCSAIDSACYGNFDFCSCPLSR